MSCWQLLCVSYPSCHVCNMIAMLNAYCPTHAIEAFLRGLVKIQKFYIAHDVNIGADFYIYKKWLDQRNKEFLLPPIIRIQH